MVRQIDFNTRTKSFSSPWIDSGIQDALNLWRRIQFSIEKLKSAEVSPLTSVEACSVNDAEFGNLLDESCQCLESAIRLYGPSYCFVSFNGGKDATVIFHLFRAAVAAYYDKQLRKHQNTLSEVVETHAEECGEIQCKAPSCVFFEAEDEFPEVKDFISEVVQTYGYCLHVYEKGVKRGIANMLADVRDSLGPHQVAIVLGTKEGDPNAGSAALFEPASDWLPPFMRINPIMKWSYGAVWRFLLSFGLDYVHLYDVGYSSLGTRSSTALNPYLYDAQTGGALPAYNLQDWSTERAGRVPTAGDSASDQDERENSHQMEAALVVVGTEILCGQRQDQNVMEAAAQLRRRHIKIRQVVMVNDDVQDIQRELLRVLDLTDIVLVCGGLGPTHDDVTLEAVADAFGVPLQESEIMEEVVTSKLGRKELRKTEQKMTYLPKTATIHFSKLENLNLEHDKDTLTLPATYKRPENNNNARLFNLSDYLWPVIRVGGVFILPGIPSLFRIQLQTVLQVLHNNVDPIFNKRFIIPLKEAEVAETIGLQEIVIKHPSVSFGLYPFEPPTRRESVVSTNSVILPAINTFHCVLYLQSDQLDSLLAAATVVEAALRSNFPDLSLTIDEHDDLP